MIEEAIRNRKLLKSANLKLRYEECFKTSWCLYLNEWKKKANTCEDSLHQSLLTTEISSARQHKTNSGKFQKKVDQIMTICQPNGSTFLVDIFMVTFSLKQ